MSGVHRREDGGSHREGLPGWRQMMVERSAVEGVVTDARSDAGMLRLQVTPMDVLDVFDLVEGVERVGHVHVDALMGGLLRYHGETSALDCFTSALAAEALLGKVTETQQAVQKCSQQLHSMLLLQKRLRRYLPALSASQVRLKPGQKPIAENRTPDFYPVSYPDI